jgi:uncharacterized membrane protein
MIFLILFILWILIGWSVGAYWVYIDVTQKNEEYNLKQLLGMVAISALFGLAMVGIFIYDQHGKKIAEFFEKPIVGRKK